MSLFSYHSGDNKSTKIYVFRETEDLLKLQNTYKCEISDYTDIMSEQECETISELLCKINEDEDLIE